MTTTDIYTIYRVTAAMVALAHRFINESSNRVFFKVESASEVGTEYTVYYNRELKHLVCDCKAGQVGTPCWHKRAASASAAEYRAERNAIRDRDMAELQTAIDGGQYTVVTDETSSSLDGVKFEVAPSGRLVPMR